MLSLQLTGICSGSFDMMLWCLWKPVGRTLQAADVIEACLQSENEFLLIRGSYHLNGCRSVYLHDPGLVPKLNRQVCNSLNIVNTEQSIDKAFLDYQKSVPLWIKWIVHPGVVFAEYLLILRPSKI